MQKIVRIIPAPGEYGEPRMCNGTKVLLSDGQELHGISAITIRAAAGDLWRAEIEVHAVPDEIEGVVAQIRESGGEAAVVDGVIVIEVPGAISPDHREWLQQNAQKAWPGRTIVVLTDGIRISRDEQLARLEEKLDRLFEADGL